MVGKASKAIENVSVSLELKMHALKKCLLKNAFFFGPSLGLWASAEAFGPQQRPLGLGRCLRKVFFSTHFSKAGILILETQNIYSVSAGNVPF